MLENKLGITNSPELIHKYLFNVIPSWLKGMVHMDVPMAVNLMVEQLVDIPVNIYNFLSSYCYYTFYKKLSKERPQTTIYWR